jgi:accessory gene regulator B
MEKLARRLAGNIARSLGYDREKESVKGYGLTAIIQVTVTVLLILLLGLLIRAPIEAMITCFSIMLYRKYSGGAHAHSAEFCTVFSVLFCAVAAVISKWLLTTIYNPIVMAVALVIIFGSSFIIVYQFAPVDSPNKPIRTEKKKKRMRRGSFIVLSVYLVLSVAFLILSYTYDPYKSYGISLLIGISWQTLTLTSLGSLVLGNMKHNFNKEVQK